MQQPPKAFLDWYSSRKVVKQNDGPANGTIAAALILLERLKLEFNLNKSAHVAEAGTQLKGASGAAVAAVLEKFGETRPFSKEGGRTNRGSLADAEALLVALKAARLGDLDTEERSAAIHIMQLFLVDRVKDYHNRQKLKLVFDPQQSTWHLVQSLLLTAMEGKKGGPVAQHLVGAKLQLRFPDITISNEPAYAGDVQTQRPGDFLVGQTAIHVTVEPMMGVYQKCRENIEKGYKPLLLVPDARLNGARQNAEQFCEKKCTVEAIESFVSQNINELSVFSTNKLSKKIKELVMVYNDRVNAVETDKSLMIELPPNLE